MTKELEFEVADN